MAQQIINVGTTANDRTGDTWRGAMIKANDNFTELFPLANNALSKTLAPAQSVVSDVNFLGAIQKSGIDLITTVDALSKTTGSAQTVIGSVDFTGGLLVDGVLVVQPTKQVVVNALADLPTPAAGIITLADDTQYLQGNSFSLGTNEVVMGDNCAFDGIDSVAVTLTYIGTADMFTITNKRARISNLTISCASGRVVNFSDNTDTIFRMHDCSVSCATFGLFDSTGTNGSTTRFTNVSPSAITSGGCTLTGGWNTWLWEISSSVITGGTMFNFGTATFDAIALDLNLINLGAGTTFISGAASSANINAGGTAIVTRSLTSGTGTILATITVDDALWNFFHNDDIADTRPDGLLSLQANATATVIAVAGTPVLVAGTWVVERASQFTGTTAGRLTYDGGKNATLPDTGSFTVEPVSGGAVNISIEIAINGVVVPNSKRTANTSAGNPVSITAPWQEVLSTTDFVEWFVTNEDTTVNILVSSAISRVN